MRARLEEAARAKKGKKGFMTPERKKKLRVSSDFNLNFNLNKTNTKKCKSQTLLRQKAAEELKREQERKATERREGIAKRIGTKQNLDGLSQGTAHKKSVL